MRTTFEQKNLRATEAVRGGYEHACEQTSKTKILVDGGDPEETRKVRALLGFVDGQTAKPYADC